MSEESTTAVELVERLTPIWRECASLPVHTSTMSPSGDQLSAGDVSVGDVAAMDLEEDDDIADEGQVEAHKLMVGCGYAFVRPNEVTEEEEALLKRMLDSEECTYKRYGSTDGYYYVPSIMTPDMIQLDISAFPILSKANVPMADTVPFPTFHGDIKVERSDAGKIFHIPGTTVATVGIKFVTGGILRVLRAPFVYRSSSADEEENDEENENASSESTEVNCLGLQNQLVNLAYKIGAVESFYGCTQVTGAIATSIAEAGEDIWTSIRVQPHDVFACMRWTLFRFEPYEDADSAYGKLVATIRQPSAKNDTRPPYSRVLEVDQALRTGIIKRDRWGVAFLGDAAPDEVSHHLWDPVLSAAPSDGPNWEGKQLMAPFHVFTTKRNWSPEWTDKFKKRYEEVLKFVRLKDDYESALVEAERLNEEGKAFRDNPLVAPSKVSQIKQSYAVQETKLSKGQTLSTESLCGKVAEMKKLIPAAQAELENLRNNAKQLEELKVKYDELKERLQGGKITSKSISTSVNTVAKRIGLCDQLPSDSRIASLSSSVGALERAIVAAEKAAEKTAEKERAKQEKAEQVQRRLPDPDTYIPPAKITAPAATKDFLVAIRPRITAVGAQLKARRKAAQHREAIEEAKRRTESLTEEELATPEGQKIAELAEELLTEEELENCKPLPNEEAFTALYKQSRELFAMASATIKGDTTGDHNVAPLDWAIDRLECWPEHPFAASRKDGADPAKKKKYGQLTLDGKIIVPAKKMTQCPNDEDCDNIKFITEEARARLRLKSRCLICEADAILSGVKTPYRRVVSAAAQGMQILSDNGDDMLRPDYVEKLNAMMSKIEKKYDLIYKCPAVSKNHREPTYWKDFVTWAGKLAGVLKKFPENKLPPAPEEDDDDEYVTPEFDQYDNEECDECGGLVLNGICADCHAGTEDVAPRRRRTRKRKRDEESEEESFEDDDENEEDDAPRSPRSNGASTKSSLSALDHAVSAYNRTSDESTKDILNEAIKRLKTDRDDMTEKFGLFVCHEQFLTKDGPVYVKESAMRLGSSVFVSEEGARLFIEEEWGNVPFVFPRRIMTTK